MTSAQGAAPAAAPGEAPVAAAAKKKPKVRVARITEIAPGPGAVAAAPQRSAEDEARLRHHEKEIGTRCAPLI